MAQIYEVYEKKMSGDLKIDFFSIINILLRNLKALLVITIIFTLSGVIFSQLKKTEMLATLEFNALSESELYEYSILNKFELLDEITPESLTQRTVGAIDNELIFNSIKDLGIVNENNFPSFNEYEDAIYREVGKLFVVKPIITKEDRILFQQTLNSNYRIMYETDLVQNSEIFQSLFQTILNAAEAKVQKNYKTNIQNIIRKEKKWINFEIQDLQKQRNILIENYVLSLNEQLRILNENLTIAESLGFTDDMILNSQIETDLFKVNPVLTDSDEELSITLSPHYYFGSVAIREQIVNLEKNIEITKNNPKNIRNKKINEIDMKIQEILQNTDIERFEDLYNLSPLVNEKNFKSIKYNPPSIEIKNQSLGKIQILLIFIISGIIASLVTILLIEIKSEMRKRYH